MWSSLFLKLLSDEESVITCFYIIGTLASMYDERKNRILKVFSVVLFTILFFFIFRPVEIKYGSYNLYLIFTIGFAVAYCICFCRRKILYAIFLSIYLMYSVVASKTALSTLEVFHLNALQDTQGNLYFYLCLYLIFIGMHIFFKTHVVDPKTKLPVKYWMTFSISSFLLVVTAQWLTNSFAGISTNEYFIPAMSQASSLLMIYYINSVLIKSLENNAQAEFMFQKMSLQVDAMRQSEAMIHQVRKERHELKNNYFYIETLIKEKNYEELDHYIKNELGKSLELTEEFRTGNHMVDYILTTKVAQARACGIHVMTIAVLPEKINVNDSDLCSLLLNLLDNAIEASKEEKQGDIHISIEMVKQFLAVQIKNLCSYDVLAKNPELLTNKKDKEHHGIGMKIVRQIVEKNDGILDLKMEDDYFVASMMLPVHQ